MDFRVWGLGFQGLGIWVEGSRCGVQVIGFRVQGLAVEIQLSGSRFSFRRTATLEHTIKLQTKTKPYRGTSLIRNRHPP